MRTDQPASDCPSCGLPIITAPYYGGVTDRVVVMDALPLRAHEFVTGEFVRRLDERVLYAEHACALGMPHA